MEQPIFDLLGDPVPANHGERGRPEHIPTDRNRNLVMQLLAFGWPQHRIAAGLGVSLPTLRKHYFSQLRQRARARDRLEAVRLSMLWEQAKLGNVAAIKEHGRLIERADLVAAQQAMQDAQDGKRPAAIGKKAAATLAAHSAGADTGWGDDLRPDPDMPLLN